MSTNAWRRVRARGIEQLRKLGGQRYGRNSTIAPPKVLSHLPYRRTLYKGDHTGVRVNTIPLGNAGLIDNLSRESGKLNNAPTGGGSRSRRTIRRSLAAGSMAGAVFRGASRDGVRGLMRNTLVVALVLVAASLPHHRPRRERRADAWRLPSCQYAIGAG